MRRGAFSAPMRSGVVSSYTPPRSRIVDLPRERRRARARSRLRTGCARLPGESSVPLGLTMMESLVETVSAGRSSNASPTAVAPALAMKVRRSNWLGNSFIAINLGEYLDSAFRVGRRPHYLEGTGGV